MNERLKYPVVIALICIVAAAGLALTFSLTKDRIAESRKSELQKGLKTVLPAEAKSVEERPLPDGDTLYVARENADKSGPELAYAAIGSAQGYSSKIKALVGVQPDMRIIAIRILEQQETPGLGERTREVPARHSIWQAVAGGSRGSKGGGEADAEPPFQKQFRQKTLNQLVLTKEQGAKNQISQLTGATITSQAVLDAVRDAVARIESARQKEK